MSKSFTTFILTVLFTFPSANEVFSQDVTLKAFVSKNSVGLEEQFTYSVEVSGKSASLPEPDFPAFNDFFVLSGPNPSSNIQWINGKMSASKTFTFYLQPKKIGSLTIGEASLNFNGKTYTAEGIKVTVTKGAGPAAQPQKQRSQQSRSDAELSGQDLYLKTFVSKRSAYLGEQIIVTYKLYFRVNVRTYNMDKYPANAGFWSEEFELPKQPKIESEIINGVQYNAATLKKAALFPTQTGELKIDPMKITVEAVAKRRRSGRSLFDSFFDDPFGRVVQKAVISKAVKINVKPLPEENKPADFTGAVGRYKFRVTADKREVRANEPITVKLLAGGTGNIKLLSLPELSLPPDIEQYDPVSKTNIKKDGQAVSGTKTVEYTLIPRIVGSYEIKPLSFSYFDPGSKKYKTITSRSIGLNIIKGKQTLAGGSQVSGSLNRQEVALLGQDIRFIKEYSDFKEIGYKPYLAGKFWASIFSGLILFIGFVFYNNRQAVLLGDEKLARSRKAGKVASRQLAAARSLIDSDKQGEFYRAVTQALQGFVRDRLNIELTEFNKRSIQRELGSRDIAEAEIAEYISVLEESDFRQYSNSSAEAEDRKNFFDKAKAILTKLEKWI